MTEMQTVKRRFFAMRNGIIADTLRRAGSPYRIIFGLNLPQIVDIAAMTPRSEALADALHANATTRCSRLMAPMIYPPELFTREKALQWMAEVLSTEEADILCHRLLRRLPFAAELVAARMPAGEGYSSKWFDYTRLRLLANLRAVGADAPELPLDQFAESEHGEIASLARMIINTL